MAFRLLVPQGDQYRDSDRISEFVGEHPTIENVNLSSSASCLRIVDTLKHPATAMVPFAMPSWHSDTLVILDSNPHKLFWGMTGANLESR